MTERLAFALVFVAFGAGCRPDAPPREDPYERAALDGGSYSYVALDVPDGGELPADDAASRPSLTRVAGVVGGRGDLDGVGADARLGVVVGMARVGDALVFADQGNGSIRRFVPSTSVVETLVRLPAPSASAPSLPAFVAYDGAGTLYVADRAAQLVYAVDLEKRVATPLAGKLGVRGDSDGPFGAATFDTPTGLVFDGAHTLYVGDVGNRRIRRLDLQTHTVSSMAPRFWQVWGLCQGKAGLHAVDLLTEALFRVDETAATPLVGTNRFGYSGVTDGRPPRARFHGPRGVACTDDAVFVAERDGLVRKWDLHAQTLTTIAGTPEMQGWRDGDARHALFWDLQSIAAWDANTLYLGDEGALRKISLPSLTITTPAGAPDQGTIDLDRIEEHALIRPKSVAFVPWDHTAYVADCGEATVRRVDLATGVMRTLAGDPSQRGFRDGFGTDARFACVSAVATDARGALFVGDSYNHAVRSVGAETGEVVTIAGTPTKCGNDDGPFAHATFCDPSALAFGGGSVFVADASTATIRRIDLDKRTVTTVAGSPFERGKADGVGAAARFSAPVSLAFHDGKLYVADRDNDAIRVVDTNGGAVSTLPTHIEHPRAIALVAADTLLVSGRR